MNFNKILQSLFGNKSTRDMKLIQPIVEKIKAEQINFQILILNPLNLIFA